MTLTKDKYLTIKHVADFLSCTEQHVYNLIIEKSLVAIKIGGRAMRVSEKSLEEFIEKRKVNPEDLFDPDNEKDNQTLPVHKEVARSRFLNK